MTTIKDVAKHAGVAVGTVSRFINGERVKEENRLKIEDAIQKLSYKVNPIAQCLKTSRTHTIGVIIPSLSDPYATTIVKSLEQKLFEYGYNIFVCDSWADPALERQKAAILAGKLIDGLIVYPCSEDVSYLAQYQSQGIPVVVIDVGTKSLECDQVLTDNVNSTYNAVEWLINSNHRRIGIINGSADYFTAGERLKGYMRVHEDYSLEVDRQLILTRGFDEKSGYTSLITLMRLDSPPTAVVACNYYTTLGLVKALYELGIKIPEQLSVIGFDNIGLSEIVQPPLTIITQPMEEMGNKAAQLLLNRINDDYSSFPSIVRLKSELIVRMSTKPI